MAETKQKADRQVQKCWDYEFAWTSDHRTAEELNPLRYSFDTLAGDCLGPLNSLAQSHSGEDNPSPWKTDMFALLQDNYCEHDALEKLWTQVNTIPDWVDWNQIARGQEVYYRYGLSMSIAVSLAIRTTTVSDNQF